MRYLKIWTQFLKMSWMADMEYRTNIVLRVVSEFMWYTMQLSVFEVLYTHTNAISGWTVQDMRVFMGSLFVGDVLYMILLHENMEHLWSVVRKGDLDLYLVKPINSQFMISCRKVSVSYFVNLVLTSCYLDWAIHQLPRPISVLQIVTFIVMIIFGLMIVYGMRFMFVTLTVVLQDSGNVQFIWYQLYRLATRPDPIYPNFLRYIVLSVFPVAFFASVPSRILVEGLKPGLLLAAPCIGVGAIWISNFLWERALRHYASASS